ncbi:MAG: MATE family efflux transporter [Burkholderiaceae bacterium]|nr:MATE family efflux transporter [Burkholderiaceae bacterium]
MTRARDVFVLGWPILVGQIAVLGNGVIDTIMAGQRSAEDLAVIGLGAAIYISVFVAFRGVLMGLTPIAAGHFGAGRLSEIGDDVGQAAWVALLLAAIGIPLLWWSDPWLGLTRPDPSLHAPLTGYLQIIALAMPSTLLYSVFFTLNSATSRPAVTMTINLVMLTIKWPLNGIFMDGIDGVIAPMGAVGCAVATAILSWSSLAVALLVLLIDRRYREFHVRLRRPQAGKISQLFKIGLPIGAGYLIEVTSFTLMALLIGRFGTIASASHQVAANLATLVFMMPLALSNATSILAAQALGAGDEPKARSWVLAGMRLVMGIAVAITIVMLVLREPLAALYAEDATVQQFARTLIIGAAVCHVLDALQCLLYSSLRAWRITFTPMLVYGVSLWGFGVGGGWWFAHALFTPGPDATQGFWMGNFLGLAIACVGLGLLLRRRFLNPVLTVKL